MVMLHRAPHGQERNHLYHNEYSLGQTRQLMVEEILIFTKTVIVPIVRLSLVPGGVSIYLIFIG